MSNKVYLVVLSGGQDSTTCLAEALDAHPEDPVCAITIDYGQRHAAELQAARRVRALAEARFARTIPHYQIPARGMLIGSSPLVNRDAKVDTYDSAAVLPGGLEKTFVPLRNTFFLTIAANHAVAIAMSQGAKEAVIITGVSQEDYGGYPDCRESFLSALTEAFQQSLDDPELPRVTIQAPLLHLNKAQPVLHSLTLPHCLEMLSWSHTCYNGSVPPCGHCHACLLRAKGFAEAGIADPLVARLSRASED